MGCVREEVKKDNQDLPKLSIPKGRHILTVIAIFLIGAFFLKDFVFLDVRNEVIHPRDPCEGVLGGRSSVPSGSYGPLASLAMLIRSYLVSCGR